MEEQIFATKNPLIKSLLERDRELFDLESAASLLSWDREAYMPNGGAENRAEAQATLSKIHHKLLTSLKLNVILDKLEREYPGGYTVYDQALIQTLTKDYKQAVKIPADLVEKLSLACSRGLTAWREAREKSDFSLFRDHLSRVVDLEKEVARHIGFNGTIYNYFLDQHEPGLTVDDLEIIFGELKPILSDILKKILASEIEIYDKHLSKKIPEKKLEKFCLMVVKAMGFDFECGKMDVTEHPMTESFTSKDVRFSIRYTEDTFTNVIFSAIHETGHALYEQGIDTRLTRTSLSKVRSLGLHESQSRFWENCIGRSGPFWSHWYFELAKIDNAVKSISLLDFTRAINKVTPSLIRVDADEVTYNLHIILRYEIERDLMEDKIHVKDLPEIWNAKMKEYLGINVPDDKHGVLQDIHWSDGSFGYFPTYTLGNLYSAQILRAAKDHFGNDYFAQSENYKNMRPLREWLKEKIHRHGSTLDSKELITRVTGRKISSEDFRIYLEEKFSEIYKW